MVLEPFEALPEFLNYIVYLIHVSALSPCQLTKTGSALLESSRKFPGSETRPICQFIKDEPICMLKPVTVFVPPGKGQQRDGFRVPNFSLRTQKVRCQPATTLGLPTAHKPYIHDETQAS